MQLGPTAPGRANFKRVRPELLEAREGKSSLVMALVSVTLFSKTAVASSEREETVRLGEGGKKERKDDGRTSCVSHNRTPSSGKTLAWERQQGERE